MLQGLLGGWMKGSLLQGCPEPLYIALGILLGLQAQHLGLPYPCTAWLINTGGAGTLHAYSQGIWGGRPKSAASIELNDSFFQYLKKKPATFDKSR